jgi:hypothetical protein
MGISRFEDSVPTVPLPLAEVRLVEAGLAPAAQCLCVCCAPRPGRCTPHASCKTEVTSAPINDMHVLRIDGCCLSVIPAGVLFLLYLKEYLLSGGGSWEMADHDIKVVEGQP